MPLLRATFALLRRTSGQVCRGTPGSACRVEARSGASKALLAEKKVGVAHHQVDVFVIEPGTDRYLGRLCWYSGCPKGKPDCIEPGCGKSPFLKQLEGFALDPEAPARGVTLCGRGTSGKSGYPPGGAPPAGG